MLFCMVFSTIGYSTGRLYATTMMPIVKWEALRFLKIPHKIPKITRSCICANALSTFLVYRGIRFHCVLAYKPTSFSSKMSVQFHSDQHSYIISCWRINLSETGFSIPYVIAFVYKWIHTESVHSQVFLVFSNPCREQAALVRSRLGFFHLFVILMKNEIKVVVVWMDE